MCDGEGWRTRRIGVFFPLHPFSVFLCLSLSICPSFSISAQIGGSTLPASKAPLASPRFAFPCLPVAIEGVDIGCWGRRREMNEMEVKLQAGPGNGLLYYHTARPRAQHAPTFQPDQKKARKKEGEKKTLFPFSPTLQAAQDKLALQLAWLWRRYFLFNN